MTSRDLSVAIFLMGLVAILVLGLFGCAEKKTQPDLRMLASISPVHGYHDYQTFMEKNQ